MLLWADLVELAFNRFISQDPGVDGLNWFTFAYNNPVGKIDKTGKETLTQACLISFVQSLLFGVTA